MMDGDVSPTRHSTARDDALYEEAYQPSFRRRIPGSKYTISEVDILEATDEITLRRLVELHRAKPGSRGEGGVCCAKKGLLEEWSWTPSLVQATKEIRVNHPELLCDAAPSTQRSPTSCDTAEEEGLPPLRVGATSLNLSCPTWASEVSQSSRGPLLQDVDQADNALLAAYLGPKGDQARGLPPNPNYFEANEVEDRSHLGRIRWIRSEAELSTLHLLHYNRKKLIDDIYAVDRLLFGNDREEAVHNVIHHIPDERIDQMSLYQCRRELRRRGYFKPPYKLSISIDQAQQDFMDSLPTVRRLTEGEAQGLLKLIGHDPRFRGAQPIVQPSSHERDCTDFVYCVMFWLYWIGMMVVMAIACSIGDTSRLIQPVDYRGDVCYSPSDWWLPTSSYMNKYGSHGRQMYYPQMAVDAAKIHQDSEYASECADSVSGCFYGICHDGCPTKGEYICTYEVQAAIDEFCSQYEEDQRSCVVGQQEDHSQNGCWLVHLNSVEIFKRCLPWEPATSETSSYTYLRHHFHERAWLAHAGADIYHSAMLITYAGLLLPAVISMLFIVLVTYLAGIVTWTMLISGQLVSIATTLFMAQQCGLINSASMRRTAELGDSTTAQAFLESYSTFGEMDEEFSGSNKSIWMIAFWVSLIVSAVYSFCLLGLRKQIALAIELIKETGRTIATMPMVLVYPAVTYPVLMVTFVCYFFIVAYIITITKNVDTYDTTYSINATYSIVQSEIAAQPIVDFNSTMAHEDPGSLVRGLLLYHTLGYFWMSAFIKAIGKLTIAGAICSNYWITNPTCVDSGVSDAFFRSIRYHASTAVLVGAISTIIRPLRTIMMYVDRQIEQLQKGNVATAIAIQLIQCYLWCFEKIVRSISDAALIMVAIEGRSFCPSALRSFKLLSSNSPQIAMTEKIALLIIVLANIGIVACCVMVTMFCINNMSMYTCVGLQLGETCDNYVGNAIIPSIFVGGTSFVIASYFVQVYSVAISTVVLSFCLDEDNFKGGKYKMPPISMQTLAMPPGKKSER